MDSKLEKAIEFADYSQTLQNPQNFHILQIVKML